MAEAVSYDETLAEALEQAEVVRNMVTDVTSLLDNARQTKQPLLFEGAQGTLLDIDHGTYPFVTSSGTPLVVWLQALVLVHVIWIMFLGL